MPLRELPYHLLAIFFAILPTVLAREAGASSGVFAGTVVVTCLCLGAWAIVFLSAINRDERNR